MEIDPKYSDDSDAIFVCVRGRRKLGKPPSDDDLNYTSLTRRTARSMAGHFLLLLSAKSTKHVERALKIEADTFLGPGRATPTTLNWN
jgi:hypothetical protein